MPANAVPAIQKKKITIVRAGHHWLFKYYFPDEDGFKELAEYYDKGCYCFVLKTPGERNLVQKLLEKRGFEVKLVENSRGYVVKLSRHSKYSSVLKNSLAQIETPEWRIFLMKDQAAVKEALRQGAKLVEVDVQF
jgi:hypothetical protein